MGMYTELVVSTQIKPIDEVIDVLKVMAGISDKHVKLPKHPLFKTPRWRSLFLSSSYYFTPRNVCLLEYDDISNTWCLITRADLKNYDGEIEKFIDWIRPYLAEAGYATMFAYSRYEETEEPTIYYS